MLGMSSTSTVASERGVGKRATAASVEQSLTPAQVKQVVERLAQVFYTEYRACDLKTKLNDCHSEWNFMFSAILNRMKYEEWWPRDFLGVINYGCQTGLCEINGLHYARASSLRTPHGQAAVTYAHKLFTTWRTGRYRLAHQAHSWATPAAAHRDRWFQTLCLHVSGPGHQYYADCDPVRVARR